MKRRSFILATAGLVGSLCGVKKWPAANRESKFYVVANHKGHICGVAVVMRMPAEGGDWAVVATCGDNPTALLIMNAYYDGYVSVVSEIGGMAGGPSRSCEDHPDHTHVLG